MFSLRCGKAADGRIEIGPRGDGELILRRGLAALVGVMLDESTTAEGATPFTRVVQR